MKKIALEEHFLSPGFETYWDPTVATVPAPLRSQLHTRLTDFGDQRLEAMNRAGIEKAVLSIAGPGVQRETNTAVACRVARESNDFLAKQIQKHPTRYLGFAHLPMQDPTAAANELERSIRDLGFCGAMINGHTNGQYLDHPSLEPFWERAASLSALVYLHPADPISPYISMAGCPALQRAMWEWGVETGTHALRLVFGGVFDRHPNFTLALGHLGETLPYLLWRFDSRAGLYGLKLPKPPSEYIRERIVVTTSGMLSAEALTCALSALGQDRVLFSVDYPFESADEAGHFIESVPLDESTRRAVCHGNAERLIKLNQTP